MHILYYISLEKSVELIFETGLPGASPQTAKTLPLEPSRPSRFEGRSCFPWPGRRRALWEALWQALWDPFGLPLTAEKKHGTKRGCKRVGARAELIGSSRLQVKAFVGRWVQWLAHRMQTWKCWTLKKWKDVKRLLWEAHPYPRTWSCLAADMLCLHKGACDCRSEVREQAKRSLPNVFCLSQAQIIGTGCPGRKNVMPSKHLGESHIAACQAVHFPP